MEKINRDTGLESEHAVNRVLLDRLLDKSDELVEEGNKLRKMIEEDDEKLEEVKEWYRTHK